MRGDLRKLLWRLRTGVVRRAALEAAVELACNRLVSRRYGSAPALQEVSEYTRPLLIEFEAEISAARLLAPEGAHRTAIQAVERAEAALEAARRMTDAHAARDALAADWYRLRDRFDLAAWDDLTTIREMAIGLEVTDSFLRAGEARKARFVAGLCRVLLERLTTPTADLVRRRSLKERLAELGRSALPCDAELCALLGRLAAGGALGLAERLLDDWEIETGPADTAGIAAVLGRISIAGREAQVLAGELALLAPPQAAATADA